MYNIAIYSIEDDEDDKRDIQEIIKDEHVVNFMFFKDGETLLANITNDIHVVILDETLPRMTGYQVLLEVKKKNSLSYTIGYSGAQDYKILLKYWKAGCDVWVDKNQERDVRLMELKKYIQKGLQEAKYRIDAIKKLTDDKKASVHDRRGKV